MKRFIVSLVGFAFVVLGGMTYAENIPVKENWTNEIDNRSLSSCPTLIKEGSTLFVLTDGILENISIAITSVDGEQVYVELNHVTVDMEYAIPVDLLPAGDYLITVRQGSKYVMGWFQID
ncbi:MAG: DUF3244 domain-containing protein [Phocaeicola sp.]|nr:DUF3244 domain-containing protein [Phocaeicola sp.]